jgi:hypothetical protein
MCENAPVVGEGVNDHRGVFAGLDDFIQVADGPVAHGLCQGAIDPDGLLVFEEKAADKIRGEQVFVAGRR